MSDNLDIPAFLRIPAARRKAATACKMLIEIMGITGCCNKSENENTPSTPREFLAHTYFLHGLLREIWVGPVQVAQGVAIPSPRGPSCRPRVVGALPSHRHNTRNGNGETLETKMTGGEARAVPNPADGRRGPIHEPFRRPARDWLLGTLRKGGAGHPMMFLGKHSAKPRTNRIESEPPKILVWFGPGNGSRSLGQHRGCKLSILTFKDPKNSTIQKIC